MRNHNYPVVGTVLLVALSLNVSHAAMVYKCKSEQGKLLYQKTPCAEEKQAAGSLTLTTEVQAVKKDEVKRKAEVLVIPKSPNGHYVLFTEANGHGINFVVDTGATMLSLPKATAAAMSLVCSDNVEMDTANGVSNGCTTTINELKMGDFILKNVPALIVPNLSRPLLGMNVLQGFNMEQRNDEMRLSERLENNPIPTEELEKPKK